MEANHQLANQIVTNLKNNGYPERKVSLPLEKMYEVAEQKGANLNQVLEDLKKLNIGHEKTLDKIIFFKIEKSQAEMMQEAQEMMGQMDPAELAKIQEQIAKMTPEQKQQMMDQAKSMGIF